MNPSRPKSPARRRPLFRIEAEALETRQLLTGGAGNTLALVRGTIAAEAGSAPVPFVVQSSHFAGPRGRLTLGVDVVPATNSSLRPVITGVEARGARTKTILFRGPKGPKALVKAASDDVAHAVLANVSYPLRGKNQATSYVVKINAAENTKGDFLLGFYLPGDADGNGKVDQVDMGVIKTLNGRTVDDSDYLFDGDANRDGRIDRTDIALARKNLGARTTITPDITANLDAASDSGASDRITSLSTVKFTGVAAPGAKITYEEVNKKTPGAAVTADDSGTYSATLNLAEGTNTYRVTSVDAFGQTISGSIQPVTYTTGAVPETAATS